MLQTPISRDSMRILRAQALEEQRKSNIKQIVSQIYSSAVNKARSTTDSKYLYEFHSRNAELCRTNMSEILAEVQSLFPECSVSNIVVAKGPDGEIFDISKIDEHLKPFIMNQVRSKEYIVVDWS